MLAQITSASIEKGMAKRAPSRAKHFLDTFRGLFKWAVKAQHCAHNPTAGLQAVLPESDGHPPWSNEWCRKFEARWPHGTRERLAYELLYWTGLRIGDAVRFGRQHVNKDGMGIIETEKTGELANVPMSKLPRLLAALAAGPTGDLTFIVSARGRPLNKFAFGAFVRRAAPRRCAGFGAWLTQNPLDADYRSRR
jgi:site-specific recombinase XerC